MSVKDVKRYYNEITAQYKEMIADIQDLEKECEQGLVEPERIDRLKEQVAPLKQNYERWAYMMFLLNQPVRKHKQNRYCKQNKCHISGLNSANSVSAVIAENKEVLNQLGE